MVADQNNFVPLPVDTTYRNAVKKWMKVSRERVCIDDRDMFLVVINGKTQCNQT